MAKLGILGRRQSNESMRLIITTVIGVVFGFLIGVSFPTVNITKLHFPSSIFSYIEDRNSSITTQALLNHAWTANQNKNMSPNSNSTKVENHKSLAIAVSIYKSNVALRRSSYMDADVMNKWWIDGSRGVERLASGIIVPESDFYLRRLWGDPHKDLAIRQKYLVTFTVGLDQKRNVDAAVKKFSENFTVLLFHYDGRTSEWDDLEWSKRAIHVSARKQTKWWYAKRFLHPDIVASYEYIFIWDEDLGVEHFNAEKYIELVKKHGLEISQPGLEPNRGLTWQMTKRRGDREVHNFVEIMATVFSRSAWRCVWHMIQNDLVHGWGLDFALRKCVEPAHEKIGVVDLQWIVHQGQAEKGKAPWEGVRGRCRKERGMFQKRMAEAEKAYYKSMGIIPPNTTST